MFAWTSRGGSLTAVRRLESRRSKPGGVFAALAIALMVGACTGAAATPSPTPGATPSWVASLWPAGTPSPLPTALESALASPTAAGSPGVFALVMGQAGRVAPDMRGVGTAGSEIDDFGFDLLRRLDATGNSCASPTSIALALAMVRPGARGTTASQMDEVLHSFGAPGQEAQIAALLQLLNSQTYYDDSDWVAAEPSATPDHTNKEPVVTLNVSDQVFSQQGMTLLPDYLNALSSGFGAGVGLLDYKTDPEGARLTINQWVSRNTGGRIPEILQPRDITAQTRIALANAIYLKAAWTTPFDPNVTTNQRFTTAGGAIVSVPTMAADWSLDYAAGNGYRAVELPYGDGWNLSMLVVVPDDMASFVAGLSSARLGQIDALADYLHDVDLTLPRFSADYRVDLVETLQAMGMTDLFDNNRADLSGITTAEQLVIYKVIHQANIDVVEQGTTASAATAIGGRAIAGPEGPPHVVFHVDRPFLYFIRERTSGAVLFMGRINDPSLKS